MDGSTGVSYEAFKEELTPILLRLFQKKFRRKKAFQVVLIPKPDEGTTQKKN